MTPAALMAASSICWGQNTDGEDGIGNTTAHNAPQQVRSDTTWTAISYNAGYTCGIDNGVFYCWGHNSNGEVGIGNTTQQNSPQAVNGLGFIGNGTNASDLLGQYSSPTSSFLI